MSNHVVEQVAPIFSITDDILGVGIDQLRMKTLRNLRTGESFGIVWESGGKTERLRLISAKTGMLRDVLQTHGNNATAVRLEEHYAGSILLPFANRIANGTYSFFGTTHHLPRNECSDPSIRCDALHGFLFNRTLRVIRSSIGSNFASLTLGYDFDGRSTPGWPFRATAEVTYALTAHDTHSSARGPGVAYITTKLTNREPTSSLPFFNSWHPYFRVSDVSRARIEFDSCGATDNASAWRHVSMGAGAPRKGTLLPSGGSTPWAPSWRIGGSRALPTYMDDEFVATTPTAAFRHGCARDANNFEQRIVDEGGDGDAAVLFADRQHRVYQIFTGAKEGWGWDAIALEPMSGLADAYNNGDGLRVLAAGEAFEGTFGVTLQ